MGQHHRVPNLFSQPDKFPTLVHLLQWRSAHQPNLTAYSFIQNDQLDVSSISYNQLNLRAQAIASSLLSHCSARQPVLLLFPPGLDFITAFFGCLYANLIPIPAYPPDLSRLNRSIARLRSIVADARPSAVLSTSSIISDAMLLLSQAPDLEALTWVASNSIPDFAAGDWHWPNISEDSLAFLQYTSGSTGSPKGVMLTHANLLHNAGMIFKAVEHSPEDKYVSWLPTFHDMGFMAGVLEPLYAGIPAILMSPLSFLQSPVKWLQAISHFKATTSGGPNFAYDLCLRKVSPEQRLSLDLSSWTVAFNGAETIRAHTIRNFAAAFRPCGFSPEAFFNCYGLAETTLILSGSPKASTPVIKSFSAAALKNHSVVDDPASDEDVLQLVGSGQVLAGQNVVIVDPQSLTRCSPSQVGEIWVSGPSVAKGYWGREDDTRKTFGAYISDTGEGPFLRTGDLGFIQEGELFITGRLKDLIIIRGLNHYPHDIELTVEKSHPALRPGCGAAFSLDVAGQECLGIVYEVDQRQQPHLDEVIKSIRRDVADHHELQPYAVALIKAGTIPKTTSGKLQRHACKQDFLDSRLNVVAQWRADLTTGATILTPTPRHAASNRQEIEDWIATYLAAKLGVSPSEIERSHPVACYGLDSLEAVELSHSSQASLGVSLSVANLLGGNSISELAAQADGDLRPFSLDSLSMEIDSEVPANSYGLSGNQRGLWLLYEMAPQSTAYNIVAAARITTELNAAALRRSFQRLVDRHASLKTTFTSLRGEPIQQVHHRMEVCFEQEDASDWTERTLSERLAQEALRPMDLERGPLLRVKLFKSAQGHVLLLSVHHIVADLWSLAILVDELGKVYEAEARGESAALPRPGIEYRDYVTWQNELVGSSRGELLWQYWQERLAGELGQMDLPTDRPRPAVQSYRGATQHRNFSRELSEAIKSVGRSRGATLYMTLLSAFQVLLSRYSRQEDILVGCPTSGRTQREMAGVVGYFVNPIVIRSNVTPDKTYDGLLGEVRRGVIEGFEHQQYPFEKIVERLEPVRDASKSPIFQVMFVLQKMALDGKQDLGAFAIGVEGAEIEAGGLRLQSMRVERRVAQFDLSLEIADTEKGLIASLEYSTDLFDAQTIARMLGHFQTLLEGVTANPGERISALALLAEYEKRQILVEWNGLKRDGPEDQCVHHLFERQAERSPDAIAVSYDGRQLTYGELNLRANQLAHHLNSLGVSSETLVGVCMERSPEMVMGLLAIIKAGAAYVPLDPAYPSQRLASMLEDSHMQVLLTQRQLVRALPADGARAICLDADWATISAHSAHNPRPRLTGRNLAYVIYTSGTTGEPKGVMIEHKSLASYVETAGVTYGVNSGDRVLQFCSISFDISGEEIYPCLTRGATLVLRSQDMIDSVPMFLAKCREWEVSVMSLPTAYWHEITAGIEGQDLTLPPSLRLVVIAGERVIPERLTTWRRLVGKNPRLINTYGPTEATISVTMHDLSASEVEGEVEGGSPREAPIGRAIPDAKVYILDKQLEPVPVGVPGELYIGGGLLARGYRNCPEANAEKFIPDPFTNTEAGRLYRSGDLARYSPDGSIEFLGRVDHQVKIRGFRIEVEEIEAMLSRYPSVRESVVVAREDVPGDKRLVAYVVLRQGDATAAGELRSYLKDRLPIYMIPFGFVFLESLPLTPNGKLDRGALPPPDQAGPQSSGTFVAPRTALEEALADIWAEVFGIKQVGIHDNFFELGGHSLLATQLVAAVCGTFQIELSLRKLFEATTVAKLSEVIIANEAVPGQSEKIARILQTIKNLSAEDSRKILHNSSEFGC